jgi:hypothetical protein
MTGLSLALFGALTIAFIADAFVVHSQAQRSALVQQRGIATSGTVQSVDNTRQCSKWLTCSYTAAFPVRLSLPVHGASTTTVHYRGYAHLLAGEQVTVLVDPQQVAYAELPGSPFTRSSDWIGGLVAAIVFALAAVFAVLALRRHLIRRRTDLATRASAPPTISV